jgi:chromate transporter
VNRPSASTHSLLILPQHSAIEHGADGFHDRSPSSEIIGPPKPGASLMTAAAFVYGIGGDDPMSKAFLHAIAAGAVGLITVVLVQLGARMLTEVADYVFVALTAVLVAHFHLPVPYALVGVGALAIWWHRPRKARPRPQDAAP